VNFVILYKDNMKYLLIFIAFIISLLFVSCIQSPEKPVQDTGLWAANFVTNYYYRVEPVLKVTGIHCVVYIDKADENKYPLTTFQSIADKFDAKIYLDDTTYFGLEPDVNNDGKIAIFILDIIDGYTMGSSYVAGYFDSTNEFSAASKPASNQMDMIYMDCSPGVPGSEEFYETIAHEFQHMINFNQKVFVQHSTEQDTWINEGLSSAAETIYSGTVNSSKVSYYNTDQYDRIRNGENFLTWRDEYENYCSVYLFFQWLRIQSGGTSIYKNIINNANPDYKSVENVIYNQIYSSSGSWDIYLRDWYIANLVNSDVSGQHWSYKNSSSLQIPSVSPRIYTGTSASLYSGDGIYKQVTSHTFTDIGDIKHVYFDTGTKAISSTGNYLICYNINGIPSTTSTSTGTLPASIVQKTSSLSNISSTVQSLPSSYPVDRIIGSKNGFKFHK
jgi:hypothetical protein